MTPAQSITRSPDRLSDQSFDQPIGGPAAPHYIVCGGNGLAYRLVHELVDNFGERVVAVLPDPAADFGPQIAALLAGGRGAVVEAAQMSVEVLKEAGAPTALGIALVDGEDQANIHNALRAQELNPRMRIVMRFSNQRLGDHVQELLGNCAALSRSATAAPAFVAAALSRPPSVEVFGRSLCIKHGAQIEPDNYLCTVASGVDARDITTISLMPPEPTAAPRRTGSGVPVGPSTAGNGTGAGADNGAGADWTAVNGSAVNGSAVNGTAAIGSGANGSAASWSPESWAAELTAPDRAALQFLDGEPKVPVPGRARLLWRLLDLIRFFAVGQLRIVLLVCLSTLALSFSVIWLLSPRPFGWAVYQTLLDLAGAAVPDTFGAASGVGGPLQRVAQVAITLCGIPLVALLTAALVEGRGRARFGAHRAPNSGISGHVVVFGLGNTGTRTVELLARLRMPVVCIERDPASRGAAIARGLGLPVVVGEGTQAAALRAARVHKSRAMMAMTGDDAANLEAALEAKAARPGLRVVVRMFDDDFAAQVYRTVDNVASRSASYLSAPSFAAALLGREVLGVLSVYRSVVIIAQFTVPDVPRSAESGPAESRPIETGPVETGPVESKPVEPRPVAAGPVESDPVDSESVESESVESGPAAGDRPSSEWRTVHDVESGGGLRVVAVKRAGAAEPEWRPVPTRFLNPGDVYIVAATRAGFGRHTGRA